jgi:hypothetical protein
MRLKAKIVPLMVTLSILTGVPADAKPALRAAVEINALAHYGILRNTPAQVCWGAGLPYIFGNVGVVTAGERTTAGQFQVFFGACGTETISEGHGSIGNIFVGGPCVVVCAYVVELMCGVNAPPEQQNCGTYTRKGSNFTATLKNVSLTSLLNDVTGRTVTGVYNNFTLKGTMKLGSPSETKGSDGIFVGTLRH